MHSKETSAPVKSNDLCGSLSNIFSGLLPSFQTIIFCVSAPYVPSLRHGFKHGIFFSFLLLSFIFPLETLCLHLGENIFLTYLINLLIQTHLIFLSTGNRTKIKGIFCGFPSTPPHPPTPASDLDSLSRPQDQLTLQHHCLGKQKHNSKIENPT